MSKKHTEALDTGTVYLIRALFAMIRHRTDDSSKRLCTALNDWITENA